MGQLNITMVVMTFKREQAWDILCEFTQSDALRQHGLAVETYLVASLLVCYGNSESKISAIWLRKTGA